MLSKVNKVRRFSMGKRGVYFTALQQNVTVDTSSQTDTIQRLIKTTE